MLSSNKYHPYPLSASYIPGLSRWRILRGGTRGWGHWPRQTWAVPRGTLKGEMRPLGVGRFPAGESIQFGSVRIGLTRTGEDGR